jgi:phosphoribosyl-dephospho-CoA transferase
MIPAVPSKQDIHERIEQFLINGTLVNDPRSISGFTTELESRLNALERQSQYDPTQWRALSRARVEWIHAGDAIAGVVHRSASTTHIANHVNAIAQQLRAKIAFFTTGNPLSAFWQSGPENWLMVLAPYEQQTTTHFTSHGIRYALGEQSPGRDWHEVIVDGRTLAWCKDRRVILAFHPFLSNAGRETSAQGENRKQALQAVLQAAVGLSDIAVNEEDTFRRWKDIHMYATWALTQTLSRTQNARSAIDELQTASDRATEQVQRLHQELQQAQARAQEAYEQEQAVGPLKVAMLQHVHTILKEPDEQLETLRALPQVTDAVLVAGTEAVVAVTTKELVIDCGRDGKRIIPPFIIHLPLSGNSLPSFPQAGSTVHPRVARDGSFDWDDIAVPLTMALGSGNLRTAFTILAGYLARPMERLPRQRSGFARAGDDHQLGFV